MTMREGIVGSLVEIALDSENPKGGWEVVLENARKELHSFYVQVYAAYGPQHARIASEFSDLKDDLRTAATKAHDLKSVSAGNLLDDIAENRLSVWLEEFKVSDAPSPGTAPPSR